MTDNACWQCVGYWFGEATQTLLGLDQSYQHVRSEHHTPKLIGMHILPAPPNFYCVMHYHTSYMSVVLCLRNVLSLC